MALNQGERKLRAQIAAHTSWANTTDRAERTSKARQAFLDSFEELVDPECVLTPSERAARAESARRAHFARMALRSAQARRRKSAS